VGLIGEHVSLRPQGREHVGLCPFHDDRSPSMTVVTHKGRAFYKCHACGAAGDALQFVIDYHQMSFPEALRFLAERAGIELRSRREADQGARAGSALLDVHEKAARFYRHVLAGEDGAAARGILERRGMAGELSDRFKLGAAPDAWDALATAVRRRGLELDPFVAGGLLKPRERGDGHYDTFRKRLIFPIKDGLGRVIAFGGRRLDDEDQPKYLNSPESRIFDKSRTLYGLHLAKRPIMDGDRAIVTEGYTDVIACHRAGFTNAVATLGTALTPEHAEVLGRLTSTVVLIFDGDEAGQRAADRAVRVFFSGSIDVRICVLPDGQDPDDLLRADDGPQRFRAALDGSIDALAFKLDRFERSLAEAGGLSARQQRLERFLQELVDLGFDGLQGIRKRLVLGSLADLMRLPVETIERSLPAGRPGRRPAAGPSVETDRSAAGEEAPAPPSRRAMAERELASIVLADRSVAAAPLDPAAAAPSPTVLDVAWRCGIEDAVAAIVLDHVRSTDDTGTDDASLADDVLASLDEDAPAGLRPGIAALVVDGFRRVEAATEPAVEQARAAVRSLQSIVHREAFRRRVVDLRSGADETGGPIDPSAILKLIDARRDETYVPTALPKIRS